MAFLKTGEAIVSFKGNLSTRWLGLTDTCLSIYEESPTPSSSCLERFVLQETMFTPLASNPKFVGPGRGELECVGEREMWYVLEGEMGETNENRRKRGEDAEETSHHHEKRTDPSPSKKSMFSKVVTRVRRGSESSRRLKEEESRRLEEIARKEEERRSIMQRVAGDTLRVAVEEEDLARVVDLLEEGAPVVGLGSKDPESGKTALHLAAGLGLTEICESLISAGANEDERDLCGNTPLMDAAAAGHAKVCNIFLAHGLDPNTTNQDGMTAILLAASHGQGLTISALCDDGADASAVDQHQRTMLHHAAMGECDLRQISFLCTLAEAEGLDTNCQDDQGDTALHIAIRLEKHNIAVVLASREFGKGRVDIPNNAKETCLHLAAYTGSSYMLHMVLNLGSPVGALNKMGRTPLHIACMQNNVEAATILVSHETDVVMALEREDITNRNPKQMMKPEPRGEFLSRLLQGNLVTHECADLLEIRGLYHDPEHQEAEMLPVLDVEMLGWVESQLDDDLPAPGGDANAPILVVAKSPDEIAEEDIAIIQTPPSEIHDQVALESKKEADMYNQLVVTKKQADDYVDQMIKLGQRAEVLVRLASRKGGHTKIINKLVEDVKHLVQQAGAAGVLQGRRSAGVEHLPLEEEEDAVVESDPASWEINYGDLKLKHSIAKGAYGEVFEGEWLGTKVAIKKLLLQRMKKSDLEEFIGEVNVMSKLRHPNILLFMGACTTDTQGRGRGLAMVTEYMSNGTVFHIVRNRHIKYTYPLMLRLALGTARGMLYLHSQRPPIIHRDLKSLNILVDDNFTPKICDFGFVAVKQEADGNPLVGSIHWLAPEQMKGAPATEKSDVFSFGVVLWELYTRQGPWPNMKPADIIQAVIAGKRNPIPPSCPKSLKMLMGLCWHADPAKRPSFDAVVRLLGMIKP